MAELYTLRPLFPGSSESDQLNKICSVLGTPSQSTWPEGLKLASQIGFRWPGFTPTSLSVLIPMAGTDGINIMSAMMEWAPEMRPSTAKSLAHPYFQASISEASPPEVNNKLPQLPTASGLSDARKPVESYKPPQQSAGGFYAPHANMPAHGDVLGSSKGGWRGGGNRVDNDVSSHSSVQGSKVPSALPAIGGGSALPAIGSDHQQGRNDGRKSSGNSGGHRKSPGNRYLRMARYQPGQPMPNFQNNLPAVRPAMGSAMAPMPAMGAGNGPMPGGGAFGGGGGAAPPRPDALPQVGGPKQPGYFGSHAARMFG